MSHSASFIRTGLLVAATQLSLCAIAFGNVVFTSSGFEEARTCASDSTCIRNGRISDVRQSGSEVASGFQLDSTTQLTSLTWIGDHFTGDDFVFRLYGEVDGHPTLTPLYEFAIGNAFTATPLVASPTFLSGWQLSADLAPFVLDANTSYFATLSGSANATSVLTYSWDVGQHSSGTSDFLRGDFTSGAWQTTDGRVAAFQLSGKVLSVVPEPMTLALLAPALAFIWLNRRRRRAE